MRRRILAFSVLATLLAAASAAAQPRVTRIEFSPATVEEGGGVWITLVGSGNCSYTIDFGDGHSERRTADLPDRLRHVYEADKEYDVIATPESPCEGVARARLDVRAIARGIWRITVEPAGVTDRPEVAVTIHGRGTCIVLVDFGDGKNQKIEGELPLSVNHAYPSTGSYDIRARTEAPCRGEAQVRVDVKAPAR